MGTSLSGRIVLIVEDEPLIAIDIASAFERAGATALTARTLADAQSLAQGDGLAAAVVDFGLGDGDADELCARLGRRRIPFVLHSGYSHPGEACRLGVSIPKPSSPDCLVDAVGELLGRH